MAKRKLDKKTALVTGGAKRLGRAVALDLAALGANVCIHFHTSRNEAEALAEELRGHGVEAWVLPADLGDPEEVEGLIGKAAELAGSIDILVNNASIFEETTFQEATLLDIADNLNINALTPFVLAREFAAQCTAGHIINLLDARMVDYDAKHFAYHLSKRLLHTLTRIMALEFAPAIQVNAVAPGLVLPPAGKDESYLQELAHTNPLESYGSAEDIVDAVRYLLTSRFVTGQVLYVDGGRHMKGSVYG